MLLSWPRSHPIDHAYALARDYGEDGWTAWLVPLTVDGLIFASSMVLLHSARRQVAFPRLARWLLGLGIAATLAANAAHELDHGPVGAVVAARPAVALVGTYGQLMLLIRETGQASQGRAVGDRVPEVDSASGIAKVSNSTRPVSRSGSLQVDPVEAFADELAAGRVSSIRAIRPRNAGCPPRTRRKPRTQASAFVLLLTEALEDAYFPVISDSTTPISSLVRWE